ncbi:MAG: CRISPR system precrRNA processing endoribonuclease RAMP protein Cas6, partial [Pseudonocardiaceae bacterium]
MSAVPAVLDLELTVPAGTQVYPARLHGAACAMLEDNSVPHTAQHKPFSVGPLFEAGAGRARWRLGWLAAAEPPPIPRTVALGPARCAVGPARPASVTFAELLTRPPVRHVELHFVSPTFFARKGRDLPLPDPVLIMRSLVARWDAHAPPELALPADVLTALLDSVYLDE